MSNECLTGVINEQYFVRVCYTLCSSKKMAEKTFYETKWKTLLLGARGGETGINFPFQS
jgi:hypothetical protein